MRTFARKQKPIQRRGMANLMRRRDKPSAAGPNPHPILHLQRTLGNQAVKRILRASAESAGASSSIAISQPGDPYEREADRVANQVMRMPHSDTPAIGRSAVGIQRICTECEQEQDQLQRLPQTGATVQPHLARKLHAASSAAAG